MFCSVLLSGMGNPSIRLERSNIIYPNVDDVDDVDVDDVVVGVVN